MTTNPTPEIYRHFRYSHLPQDLQGISAPFEALARDLISRYPPSEELTSCLRKLLEAKDCAVRVAVARLEALRELGAVGGQTPAGSSSSAWLGGAEAVPDASPADVAPGTS